MRPLSFCTLLCASSVLMPALCSTAYAQAPGVVAQDAPVLTPPVVLKDAKVVYPAKAIAEKHFEEAVVTLLLDIDREGAVVKVASAASAPPDEHGFYAEAEATAKRLVFTAATRNGSAITARIKYSYTFRPPAPVLVGRALREDNDAVLANTEVRVTNASGEVLTQMTDAKGHFRFEGLKVGRIQVHIAGDGLSPIDAEETLAYAEETELILHGKAIPPAAIAGDTASAEDTPEEVAVRGEKPTREVLKRSLSREEMQQIPGTNGDALRSIQSLPGVARALPFDGRLIVRGSADEDTQVFVDGTPIPLIFHFGGLSSVLPTESLERLDFYPGNFSAAFGRGMGGVVDVGLRDPANDKRVHGMAQLDLIDARLMVSAEIAAGWKFRLSGRRSWFDAWLGPILKSTNAGVSTVPRYYDYQAMLQKDFSANHSFRLAFFGADDGFEAVSGRGSVGTGLRFWRAQALYRNKISEAADFKIVAAFGRNANESFAGPTAINFKQYPFTTRTEVSYKLDARVKANIGIDMAYEPTNYNATFPRGALSDAVGGSTDERVITTGSSSTRFALGAFTEWELTPWKGARVVPGLRADHASYSSGADLSPRINVKQALSSGSQATALKGAFGLFYQPPGIQEGDSKFGQAGLKSKRAYHADLGVDQNFSEAIKLSIDAFYKQIQRLVIQDKLNAGEGRAYGVEALLRYQGDPKLFGWVSYTISRSERRDSESSAWRSFENDQTHIMTVLGSYDVGRGWRLGGRFRLVSGNLYTPTSGGAFDGTVGSYLSADNAFKFSSRLPTFHQLDARVDKVWQFKDWKLTGYLDVQNIYNHRAVEAVSYNYDYTTAAFVRGLTLLPSLGLRAEF
jgi:TonB-dependent Receptor Plug Domain